jgi:hypothetical protein
MAQAKTGADGARPEKAQEARVDRDLMLDGKGRVRQRKPSPNAWSRDKEKAFLTSLGQTCNVKLAAHEAGVSPQHAYARRKTHAAFRAGWIEAIGVAYGRLELILLDRALNGTEKIITRRDGSEERMVEYSNQVALTLLKMHRETAMEADEEVHSDDITELREKISKKLDRLREQEDRRQAESGQAESGDAK